MTETDLVNSEEAARLLGINRSTINRWAKSGKLPAVYEPATETGMRLFRREDVEAMPAKRSGRPAA